MAHKFVLNNGLTVIIEEMPHLPVAAIQCGFKVGSIYEKKNEAGLCHLIEHMLFKGTKKRPKAGQLAYDAESIGADINAFTSFENTVYHLTLSSRYFTEGLDILADLILNPLFDAEELAKEKEVVCEEIRRGNDQPSQVLSDLLFKTAFRKHPYRLPIIGTPTSVKSFPASQLKSFYQKWYGAKNAVVVVVSDLPVAEVLKQVKRAFGRFQGGHPTHPALPMESAPRQKRAVWKRKDIQGTYFDLAWPIPAFEHPDGPALDLLSHLLGEGSASRLDTAVKERDHLVQSIYSYAYTPKDPGLFVVGGLTQEKDIKKAMRSILAEVEKMKSNIGEDELNRARLNVESDRYYEKQTVDGVARKLMFFECTTGDFASESIYYGRLSAVTARDIERVATQYLTEDRMTLAVLSKGEATMTAKDLSAAPSKTEKTRAVRRYVPLEHVKDLSLYRLKNGVRVLTRVIPGLPIIALRAGMAGGLVHETRETNGEFNLIARLLTKGTKRRTNEAIALDSEKMAGDVDGFTGRHAVGLSAKMLASKAELGFDLVFDTLKNPSFDESQFKREQFLALEALRQQGDYPASVLWKAFLKRLFPNHAYGMPSSGDPKTVSALTAAQLKRTYFNRLRSEELIFSLAGDFNPEWALGAIEAQCADLPRGQVPREKRVHDPKPTRPILHTIELKKEQAHIAFGFQGASLTSEDRYALAILNTVLAGQGGRLFLELRDKQSLAYTVTSYLMEGRDPGYFAVYIACDPKKVDVAIDGIRRELESVCAKVITQDELSRAKHQLICGYEMDLQRYGNVAHHLFSSELYGLPMSDYYSIPKRFEKISAEDVRKAARHYIDLNASVLCTLRP